MNFEITEALKAKLDKAESLEEVAKICAEEGLEITAEELKALMAEQSGELDLDALDNVAGGAIGIRAPSYMDAARKIAKWIVSKFK